MDQSDDTRENSTRSRCARAFESKWIRQIPETTPAEFLAVLDSCPCSINQYLRRLHNLALGLLLVELVQVLQPCILQVRWFAAS